MLSKKAKVEQFDAVQKERDLYNLALHDMQNEHVHWGGWEREADGQGKYKAGLSRHGSLLLTVFRHPGQQDAIRVYEADKEIAEIYRLRVGSEHYEAIYQAIQNARFALKLAEEKVANG